MNRFRMIDDLKRAINNIDRKEPVSFFLTGLRKEDRGHYFEVLPYLETHPEGYLLQYYFIEIFFSNNGLNIQTYHMDQRLAKAKYISDEDIFKKSVSNRMYARMKYLEKSKGYTLLKTSGNDTVLVENLPIFSEKDGLNKDQKRGYDLSLNFIQEDNTIEVKESSRPLLDIKLYNQKYRRGIYIGGRALIEYDINENVDVLLENFVATFLTNPTVEIYGKFLNIHNEDAHLLFKDSLLYNVYKIVMREFFFGPDSTPQVDNVEDVMTPIDKEEEEEKTHKIPCAYTDGYNDGTPVGNLVNPDTGGEIKIVANSTSIIRQENPGNIFRDHLEKGPIKGTTIPAEERTSTNDDEEGEYSYRVECIYGFKNEMDADIFELLLDDIAQLDISEKVKILKYIKNLKISKENK